MIKRSYFPTRYDPMRQIPMSVPAISFPKKMNERKGTRVPSPSKSIPFHLWERKRREPCTWKFTRPWPAIEPFSIRHDLIPPLSMFERKKYKQQSF